MNEAKEKEFIYVPVPQMDQTMNMEEDEIDLLELWNIIWKGKWFIAGLTLAATLVAVYVSLFVLPVTYKSDVVLQLTETGGQSGLSALASSLPFSIPMGGGGNKSQGIVAFLNSRSIKQRLIEKYDLLHKLYSDIWDEENKKWIVETPEQIPTMLQAVKDLKVEADLDDKTNLLTLSWIDEDPEFTKIMLERVVQETRHYLENEYESDAKREREFVESRLVKAETELDYWEKQVPSATLTLSKIQRERAVVQSVYAELRKQLELAKINEVKEIIRFKVLDEAYVPESRFKPKRSMICALTIVASGFFSVFLVFLRNFVVNIRKDTKH